jgi:hypothetical protein
MFSFWGQLKLLFFPLGNMVFFEKNIFKKLIKKKFPRKENGTLHTYPQ